MNIQPSCAVDARGRSRAEECEKRPDSRWLSNGSVVTGGAVVALYLIVPVVSLVWAPSDPNTVDPVGRLTPTGTPGCLLGTDSLSRDVVSTLLADAKNSTTVAAGTCGLNVVADTALGLVTTSFGRTTDELVMRTIGVCVSIPGVVIAPVLVVTIGSGIASTIFALLFFFTPAFTQMVRANALRILTEDLPGVAELYGRSRPFVAIRHVLPNIFSILLMQTSQYYAATILTEAGLSYLGVGVNRPEISWGIILKEIQQTVGIDSPLAMWPGVAIMVTVPGLNILSDGVRDVFDSKLRRTDR